MKAASRQQHSDYVAVNETATSWAHETAVVAAGATIGEGVRIGPFAVVGEQVTIGDGTRIAAHAVVDGWTTVGRECRIFPSAVLGSDPQDLKYAGEQSALEIGDHNIIREFVTLNRATGMGGGRTLIGDHNLFMAYVHVAHDCIIGSHAILANAVNLAGHVTIDDYASVGGMTPVHQFVRIGRYAFVGGGSRVSKDIPPYVRAAGNPTRVVGLNSIGLQRRGLSEEVRLELKRAYRLLYRSGLNVSQALARMRSDLPPLEEVRYLIEFVERSARGIERGSA